MKKRLLFLIIFIVCSVSIYAQTKPTGTPPAPWWSPAPNTAQEYINAICGSGDAYYQAWCAWLRLHPEDVPESYYTHITCIPNWQCTAWSSCVNGQQTRICDDSNNCGTTTGKPSETQYCSLTTNSIVSRSDFKTILISSLINYFTNPNNSRLNVNELKDLIVAYFSSSGNTIDLSNIGSFSNEKLETIYNKAKGGCGACPTGQTCVNGKCSSINIKDLTPNYVRVRYIVVCGSDHGESILPGETKYYQIDMKRWIEWQRVAYAASVYDNQREQNMKTYEEIYQTGDYTVILPTYLVVGCTAYAQTGWGCEEGGAKFDIAIGYNKVPVYEEIDFSNNKNYAYFGRELNDTNPIMAISSFLQTYDLSDNNPNQVILIAPHTTMIGPDYVYIMVHNVATFDPVSYEYKYSGYYPRNFKIIMYCPDGYRKCHADADCIKCPNAGCFTQMDLLRWQGISVNSNNCPDMGLEASYTFDCKCGIKNFCTMTNVVAKPIPKID